MEWLYMFTGDTTPNKDFVFVNETDFVSQFDLPKAIGFLTTIEGRLETELPARANAYYSQLRHIFAELDGLGQLFAGDEHGKQGMPQHAIAYGEKYLGALNHRYEDVFCLLISLHRHGLTHTGLITQVRLSTRPAQLGWELNVDGDHLELKRAGILASGLKLFNLSLDVRKFRNDAIASIARFKNDLNAEGLNSPLFEQFRRGYYGTAVVRHESPAKPPSGATTPAPFTAVHVEAARYAAPGFTWVAKELTDRGW